MKKNEEEFKQVVEFLNNLRSYDDVSLVARNIPMTTTGL